MDKYRIYIPVDYEDNVGEALSAVAKCSGGSTSWEAYGTYYGEFSDLEFANPDMATGFSGEDIVIYEFNGATNIIPLIKDVILELKALGEAEVLVEVIHGIGRIY